MPSAEDGARPLPSSGSGSVAEDTMAFIANFDTPIARIYNDNGKPAIGFGHNITSREIADGKVGGLPLRRVAKSRSNPFGLVIDGPVTQKAIQTLFKQDVQESIAAAQNAFPGKLSKNMTVGLASFFYNLGNNRLERKSSERLRAAVASGSPAEIANAFLAFDKAVSPESGRLETREGLVRRREAEASLVVTPDGEDAISEVLPLAAEAFDLGRVGAGATQDAVSAIRADPNAMAELRGFREAPLTLPGPVGNDPTAGDIPAQDVIRAIQGSGAPARVK